MQTCRACNTPFEITVADHEFFDKFKVSPPAYCLTCVLKQLLQFRNERTLFSRACALCSKNIISIYHPDEPHTVYCRSCYFSDRWDGKTYAREYDSSRSFFDQLEELDKTVPQQTTFVDGPGANSEFTNFAGYNNNCYMIFNAGYNENCYYSRGIAESKELIDRYFCQVSELCYEVMDGKGNYTTFFSDHTYDCRDCWFLFDCRDCSDCFGCVNLRHKRYCFYNEQLTKEEYATRLAPIRGSYKEIEKHKKQFETFKKHFPIAATHNYKSEDSEGNYIVNSSNCHNCFEAFNCENGCNLYFNKHTKDSRYLVGHGYHSELLYCDVACGNSYGVILSYGVDNCSHVAYCMNVHGSEHVFGCSGMNKASYCILNKQYSKEEYHRLREQIIEDMKACGEWGVYLPARLSPFCYNETLAMDFFPATRQQVEALGFRWRESALGDVGHAAVRQEDIPDGIKEVPESITSALLTCAHCGKHYKIIKQELAFYKKWGIPLPRHCFNCRHADRMRRRGPFMLIARVCNQCGVQVRTSYAEEIAPILYCQTCFERTVV